MIGGEVDAPGDAPSRAARVWSLSVTISVPNCSTGLQRIALDDLHALAGGDQLPVTRLGIGEVLDQFGLAVGIVQARLSHQVLHQVQVVLPTSSIGPTLLWFTDE